MKKGSIKRAFTYLESGAVLLVTTNDGTRDNVMTILLIGIILSIKSLAKILSLTDLS